MDARTRGIIVGVGALFGGAAAARLVDDGVSVAAGVGAAVAAVAGLVLRGALPRHRRS